MRRLASTLEPLLGLRFSGETNFACSRFRESRKGTSQTCHEVAAGFNNELQDMALAIKQDDSTRIVTLLKTWEFQTVRIFNVDEPALINLDDESLEGIVADAGTAIYFPLAKPELLEQAKQVFGTHGIRVSTTEDANGLGF